MYDTCEFNRCDIRNNDYASLKYWLFQVHNSATKSIFNEKIKSILIIENDTYNRDHNGKSDNLLKNNSLISNNPTCNSSFPSIINGANKIISPLNIINNLDINDSTFSCSHTLNSSLPHILYPPLTSCLSCYNQSVVNRDILSNDHHNNINDNENRIKSEHLWNYNEIQKHLNLSYWDEKWTL